MCEKVFFIFDVQLLEAAVLMKYLVVDCETLGTQDRSVILEATFAYIDTEWPTIDNDTLFDDKNFLSMKFLVKPQVEKKRVIEQGTLDWWREQSEAVRARVLGPSPNTIDPAEGFDQLQKFLHSHNWNKRDLYYWWQRGTKDSDWLTSLWEDFGIERQNFPWAYGRIRDIRTAVDVLGASEKLTGYPSELVEFEQQIPGFRKHDSKFDVMLDILIMRHAGLLGGGQSNDD